MPQTHSLASTNDAITFLDKSIASDKLHIKSQVDILNGNWNIKMEGNNLNFKKNNKTQAAFVKQTGLRVNKINSGATIITADASNNIFPKSLLNRKHEMFHTYLAPNTVEIACNLTDRYIVSASGQYYARYAFTDADNVNTFSLYERVSAKSDVHSFNEIINTTFVGTSNMSGAIIYGDYNFDTIFELLPFYDYNGISKIGILRIYSRSSSRLELVQTLFDSAFNITQFMVSHDGRTILIMSITESKSKFRIYKKNCGSLKWDIYDEHDIVIDDKYATFAYPIAISHNGFRFFLCVCYGDNDTYDVVAYDQSKGKYANIKFPTPSSTKADVFSGSFSPDGLTFLLTNASDNVIRLFEYKNKWIVKTTINISDNMSVVFNGKYIAAIKNANADAAGEFTVYGISHMNEAQIVARFDDIKNSSNRAICIDDCDIIWYVNVNSNIQLNRILPTGSAFQTAITRDIKTPISYMNTSTSDIGSSTYAYANLYSQNGVTIVSDERQKENIRPLQNSIDILRTFRPVSYMLSNEHDSEWHHGLLTADGKSMGYEEILSIIVGSIKNIKTRINSLM